MRWKLTDRRSLLAGPRDLDVRDSAEMVYAAPSLMAHYLAEHNYLPRPAFVEAIGGLAEYLFCAPLDAPVPVARDRPERGSMRVQIMVHPCCGGLAIIASA